MSRGLGRWAFPEFTRCQNCGESFLYTSAYDAHRAGSDVHRRCLEPGEMLASGFHHTKKGNWLLREQLVQVGPAREESRRILGPLPGIGATCARCGERFMSAAVLNAHLVHGECCCEGNLRLQRLPGGEWEWAPHTLTIRAARQ